MKEFDENTKDRFAKIIPNLVNCAAYIDDGEEGLDERTRQVRTSLIDLCGGIAAKHGISAKQQLLEEFIEWYNRFQGGLPLDGRMMAQQFLAEENH